MKRDIENREDIELMVDEFYEKIKTDPVIGFIFNDIAKVNYNKLLLTMYDFWENTIFFTGGYDGNPMKIHKQLNQLITLKKEHFSQWDRLFSENVDALFEGRNASLAKQRAANISAVMQIKIIQE